jgi:hypothetical protein
MTLRRFPLYRFLVAAIVLIGCRDRTSSGNIDSAASKTIAPPVTGSSSGTGWDPAAGPVLIIAVSKTPADAVIILPGLTDSALAATMHFELGGLENMTIELFNAKGLVGASSLQVSSQSVDPSGCVKWPAGTLTGSVIPGWTVALEKGKATGIPLDSMEEISGRDSVQFVADILKSVQSLIDSGNRAFRGIPFSVRKGYRLTIPGSSVIIGDVVRRINEEANPREEHLFLLAERLGNGPAYRIGYHMRSAGAEESLETSEILSALHLTESGKVAIVMTFDYEDGGKIGLLERVAANDWRVVWKSAYTDC